MKIGLVVHSGRAASLEAAADAARLLHDLGVEVVVARMGDDPDVVPAQLVEPEDFGPGLDLAVSFGGDGTFLRAAHLSRDAGTPVLGVNLGRLGFLAEIEVDDLASAMRAVAVGEFAVEERSTLEIEVRDAEGHALGDGWALNEVSIEKSARQRLLLMDVHVNETMFARIPADALIVASTTGSTAYAFSAGGPILSPSVPATLVVPVAPHSLFDRTLVTGPEETVRVRLAPDQAPAIVSCDGREPLEAPAGGAVTVRGRGDPVRLARVGVLDFYGLVRRKFDLH